MNKHIKLVLYLAIVISIATWNWGCNKEQQTYFQELTTIFDELGKQVVSAGHVTIICDVSEQELESHNLVLENMGFHNWNLLLSSEGFLLKTNQQIIFTGNKLKPIMYCVSSTRIGKYTPVILLDKISKTLYCVLSTDVGG